MSTETTVRPTITGHDGKVLIQFGAEAYVEMTAETSDEFARQVLVAGAKARGETGHLFIVPVVDPLKALANAAPNGEANV